MTILPSEIHEWKYTAGIILCLCIWALPLQAGTGISPEREGLKINLEDAIYLALRTNRTVKSSSLERVVQKFDLKVAQDKFNVNIDFNSRVSYSDFKTDTEQQDTASSSDLSLTSSLTTQKSFESGGQLSFIWNRSDEWLSSNSSVDEQNDRNTWLVEFTHPLLRGAGMSVNTASVTLAEFNEQSNLLNHRDVVISTVNSTIQTFRSYAKSNRQVAIIEASLARSRASLEMNKTLISMGRIPANEIIQSESDVANQEFSYETALNDLDRARLELLKNLDISRNTMITPIEETDLSPVYPDLDMCLAVAFKNRSDYLNGLIAVEKAQISLVLAKDNMKWDLDFASRVSVVGDKLENSADSDSYNWTIGLELEVPLYGDLSREQTLLSAETSLKKAKLALDEIKQNITIEVQDAVREVSTRLKQVGMAERARQLADRKLEVEREKLQVGRTTNFQLVTFQNELVDAQNAELNAKVDYLNSLTSLDTILGTTLETWKIGYNTEYDKWPGL